MTNGDDARSSTAGNYASVNALQTMIGGFLDAPVLEAAAGGGA